MSDHDPKQPEDVVVTFLESTDIRASIYDLIVGDALKTDTKAEVLCKLSDCLLAAGDKATALHCLAHATRLFLEAKVSCDGAAISYIACGEYEKALEVVLKSALNLATFNADQRGAVLEAYMRAHCQPVREHGHELLMAHLRRWQVPHTASSAAARRKPVMIEIGSTREDIPGQNSTQKLAEFCNAFGIDFTTVDMDPINTKEAERTFDSIGFCGLAINARGEEYLRDYVGTIDFAFLDAYDFDHGNHSELRQSRYRTYLGENINDKDCHAMHLECARALADKLALDGLICIDDAWLEETNWKAKGTLAVPFLLDNGFEIVENRSRAVLLRRVR